MYILVFFLDSLKIPTSIDLLLRFFKKITFSKLLIIILPILYIVAGLTAILNIKYYFKPLAVKLYYIESPL